VKVNVDDSYIEKTGRGGIGMTEYGSIVLSASYNIDNWFDVVETEANATLLAQKSAQVSMNRSSWKLIVMLSLMGSVAQITKPLGVLQVMKQLSVDVHLSEVQN
jgi:hypothetical protein